MINLKSFSVSLAVLTSALFIPFSANAGDTVEQGVLKIGTDLTYPPYNYFDDNKNPAGFDVELMSAIANKVNKKVKFLDTRFENLILGVNSGQFDVIASTLYVKPARAEKIDYIAYMKTGVSIAVASNSGLSFKSPEALCGRIVGSIKGAAWLAEIEKLNQSTCASSPIDSREFPTSPEVTQALLSGGVDAQIEDSAVLAEAVKKTKGRIAISSTEQFYPVIVGLGVRKGNEGLAKAIREALKELEEDGAYGNLLSDYNVDKPTEEEFIAAIGG